MTYVWVRGTFASTAYQSGSVNLSHTAAGHTIVRVHLRWGMFGHTAGTAYLSTVAQNIISLGVVTTVGNGTETPPNPRTAAGDAAPPTQRWIYLETRPIYITAYDIAGNLATWRDAGASEETGTKGQVLATGMPAGDTLNSWISWASPFAWDSTGQAVISGGYSLLVDQH